MTWTQLKNLTAIMLIGDGVLTTLRPHSDADTRNTGSGNTGPEPWKALMRYLSDHRDMVRAIGMAEVALGLALVAGNGIAAREQREQMEEEAAALRARIRSIA
jgi:hypothetical protein